jgi:hypothetical protein
MVAVLVVLGVIASFVLPSFAMPRADEVSIERVVLSARSTAIARGQPLSLRVDTSGHWLLATSNADSVIQQGLAKADSPDDVLELELSPLGTCIARRAPPGWDAVRCRSPSPTPRGEQ